MLSTWSPQALRGGTAYNPDLSDVALLRHGVDLGRHVMATGATHPGGRFWNASEPLRPGKKITQMKRWPSTSQSPTSETYGLTKLNSFFNSFYWTYWTHIKSYIQIIKLYARCRMFQYQMKQGVTASTSHFELRSIQAPARVSCQAATPRSARGWFHRIRVALPIDGIGRHSWAPAFPAILASETVRWLSLAHVKPDSW